MSESRADDLEALANRPLVSRSAGGIPLYGPFMVDPNSSSTGPPNDAEPSITRHNRRPATTSNASFSFTEAMASYFPFRFDNPEVSSPVPDVVRISQTRILLTRLLPDELIDPIMRHAGLMFDHLSERDEGRPIVYHDSSGQIWAMEDRQAREQRWIFLRSRPLVGPTDVEFARSHGDQAQEEGGEEVHVVQDVDDEQKEEDIVVDDDRNKRNPWRIKRITIMTNSRDQGWSNDEAHHGEPANAYRRMIQVENISSTWRDCLSSGTYAHAYSWFEVVVERNGVLLDGEYVLQYNMHGESDER